MENKKNSGFFLGSKDGGKTYPGYTAFKKGAQLHKEGYLDDALEYYQLAIQEASGYFPEAYDNTVLIYISKGDIGTALKICEENSKQVDNEVKEKVKNIVFRLESEIDILNSIFSANLNDFNLAISIAMRCRALNDFDKAVYFLQKAIEVQHKDLLLYFSLSSIYAEKEDIRNQIDILLVAQSIFPNEWKIYKELAIAWEKEGLIHEAVENYEKAMHFNNDEDIRNEMKRKIEALKRW